MPHCSLSCLDRSLKPAMFLNIMCSNWLPIGSCAFIRHSVVLWARLFTGVKNVVRTNAYGKTVVIECTSNSSQVHKGQTCSVFFNYNSTLAVTHFYFMMETCQMLYFRFRLETWSQTRYVTLSIHFINLHYSWLHNCVSSKYVSFYNSLIQARILNRLI